MADAAAFESKVRPCWHGMAWHGTTACAQRAPERAWFTSLRARSLRAVTGRVAELHEAVRGGRKPTIASPVMTAALFGSRPGSRVQELALFNA